MSFATLNGLFSDTLISATELNRQPGRILDRANEHPLTITRNDQSFALTRRDFMAQIIATAHLSQGVLETLLAAMILLTGREIGIEHPHRWMSVFDADELQEFIGEVLEAYRVANYSEESIEQIDAIIHEWHESAIAIASPDLAEAFSNDDEADELPLTQPTAECFA